MEKKEKISLEQIREAIKQADANIKLEEVKVDKQVISKNQNSKVLIRNNKKW